MAIVGPGSVVQSEILPSAMLDGASEYEYVTILNPLTDDFAIQVAQTKPVDLPFKINKDPRTAGVTSSENDARQVYGLQLKNPDFSSRKHILNTTVVKAGKTVNLRGDDAQVAVRQIVNELIQRAGRTQFLADANVRREYEQMVIIRRGSVDDLMSNTMQSTTSIINDTINKSNEVKDEEAFAELRSVDGTKEAGSVPTGNSDTVAENTTSKSKK